MSPMCASCPMQDAAAELTARLAAVDWAAIDSAHGSAQGLSEQFSADIPLLLHDGRRALFLQKAGPSVGCARQLWTAWVTDPPLPCRPADQDASERGIMQRVQVCKSLVEVELYCRRCVEHVAGCVEAHVAGQLGRAPCTRLFDCFESHDAVSTDRNRLEQATHPLRPCRPPRYQH